MQIYKDYYKFDNNDDYKCFHNDKGLLNINFALACEGVKIVLSKISDQSFTINVNGDDNQLLFITDLLYGLDRSNRSNSVLYIDGFSRANDEGPRYGRKIATLIRQFAEARNFDWIWLEPAACETIVPGAVNQDQLEAFYEGVFTSDLVSYKIESKDELHYLGMSDYVDYFITPEDKHKIGM